MQGRRKFLTGVFSELGCRLAGFGGDDASRKAIMEAVAENPWYTPDGIRNAVLAIRAQMLGRGKMDAWLEAYPELPSAHPRGIGVIMAGNIPLVGFFDMLCVVLAGHTCYYKPSSKDAVLMDYMAGLLYGIWPGIPLYAYVGQPLDAVVATGGDNAVRQFRARYGNLPSILRGNRASAAVMAGDETEDEIAGLAGDIFSYSGLGCRNVSHLLLPKGCGPRGLLPGLNAFGVPSPKYYNNFIQRRAVLAMQGEDFTEGDFFVMRGGGGFPANISEITYHFYDGMDEAYDWLSANDAQLQCVVGRRLSHPRAAGFGRSQSPGLTDYPDGVDVMSFLAGLEK